VPLTDAISHHPLAAPGLPHAASRFPSRRPSRLASRRRVAATAAAALLIAAAATTYAFNARRDNVAIRATATTSPYEPHELIVGYRGAATTLIAEVDTKTALHVTLSSHPETTPNEALLQLPATVTPIQAAQAIKKLAGVSTALPDYIAHIAGQWFPDDPGHAGKTHGWENLQWNFLAKAGVNAPQAWSNLLADHRPGAKGVVIAVVDTGIAFRNWKNFKQSPDFRGTRFADPCDLVVGSIKKGVCTDPYALDREGHGTFVAGTIAEATNNNYGLTGLAYQATVMPVRVLDAEGNGDSSTIAAGIRYAVAHGAQVINLSIVFTAGTTAGQIPDVVSAITYAHNHGVVVVGAAGNDEDSSLDFPAALPDVISVGATTRDRCLALYSDVGKNLDLVAPGGGNDVDSVTDSRCYPQRNLPDIYQMTFGNSSQPSQFGLPRGWFGTSMSAPNVTAAAAMVIASGVLGKHPTPTQILNRLEATAHPLGNGQPNNAYGYGLVNIGAATKKGGPLAPPTKTYSLAGANAVSIVR
jgi:serine protease